MLTWILAIVSRTFAPWLSGLDYRPAFLFIRKINPQVRQRLVWNHTKSRLLGQVRRRRYSRKLGVKIPSILVIDPTDRCNLKCEGCYAASYGHTNTLDIATLDRTVTQAKAMGVFSVVFSGGEPLLCRDEIFELIERHDDVVFAAFTNGLLVNEDIVERIRHNGNLFLGISLEGFEATTDARRGQGTFSRVMRAMDILREAELPFWCSVTFTSRNGEEIVSDDFFEMLIERGCLFGIYHLYRPLGERADLALVPSAAQREMVRRRILHIRTTRPIWVLDPHDGLFTHGCIAGGNRYIHINARGDVEPCPFVHFFMNNIKEVDLETALTSPLMMAFQRRQPVSDNLLRPCPIMDVPSVLRQIIAESGAYPSYCGAEAVLTTLGTPLDELATEWKVVADRMWAEEVK